MAHAIRLVGLTKAYGTILLFLQVLITPALTFQVDVQMFCQRISVVEIALTMGYLVVFTVICFAGAPPLDPADFFKFYEVHDRQVHELRKPILSIELEDNWKGYRIHNWPVHEFLSQSCT